MDQLAHSASKKLAAAGREIRYFEYRLKKKAQQKQTGKPGASSSSSKTKSPQPGSTEMEAARPQTMNEEDLQLQLALEMSKAEADKSTTDTVKEDLRLKMAIQESLKEEGESSPRKPEQKSNSSNKQQKVAVASSGLLDLGDPWSIGNNSQPNNQNIAQHNGQALQAQDPFASAPNSSDPWGLGVPTTSKSTTNSVNATKNNADPWGASPQAPVQTVQNPTDGFSTDPWGSSENGNQNKVQQQHQQPVQQLQQTTDFDPWGNATTTQNNASPANLQQTVIDPFDMNSMFSAAPTTGDSSENKPVEKNLAKNFLGDIGANLVNLDSLSFTAQTQQLQPTSTNLQPSVPVHNNNSMKLSASPNVFDMNLNSTNPFSSSVVHSTGNVFSTQQATNNPFAAPPAHMGPTLNQLKAKAQPVADFPIADFSNGGFLQPTQVAAPNSSNMYINPFQ